MKVMRKGGGTPLEAFLYKGEKLEMPEGQEKVLDHCGNEADAGEYIVVSETGWLMAYDRGKFKEQFEPYKEPPEKPKIIHHPFRRIDLSKAPKATPPKPLEPTEEPKIIETKPKKAPKKAAKKKATKGKK